MGMNEHEKMVRELELALQAARTAKAKGLLGEGADEVIRKAEEDLAKAKIYDFKAGDKVADLPTKETPSNRAVFPARDGKPARIEPDVRGRVNIEEQEGRDKDNWHSQTLNLEKPKKKRSKKTVREILKADLAKAWDPKTGAHSSDQKGVHAEAVPGSKTRRGGSIQGSTLGESRDLGFHSRMARHYPSSMGSAKASARKKLEELKGMPSPKLPKSEIAKDEPLSKPYASDAQRRWAHTEAGTKALGGKSKVKEWDKESKGKDLPEKVSKAKIDEGRTESQKRRARADRNQGGSKGVHRWSPERMGGTSTPAHAARAKQTHLDVLDEQRSMPSPKLPKSEMTKAKIDEGKPLDAKVSDRNSRGEQMERGVHPPLKYGGKGMKGTSIAGGYLEEGSKGDVKRWHNKVSDELRSMKSPKLPKSELIKEELRKPFQPRYKKD